MQGCSIFSDSLYLFLTLSQNANGPQAVSVGIWHLFPFMNLFPLHFNLDAGNYFWHLC